MRKIDITVTAVENLNRNLIGEMITFSYDGYHEKNSRAMMAMPAWVQAELKKLCLGQPKVSGRKTVNVYNPANPEETMTLAVERYIDLTMGQIPALKAEMDPDREALVDATGQIRYTYDQLKTASDNVAKSLIELGVQSGDNVAIIMKNSPEQIISKFAIFKAGAVVVNLSIFEKRTTLEQLLLQSNVSVIIMNAGFKTTENIEMLYEICPEFRYETAGNLRSKKFPLLKTVIITDSEVNFPGTFRFNDLILKGKNLPNYEMEKRIVSLSHKEVATIIHTSGTTELPKGVMLTHGTVIENAFSHILALELTKEDRLCVPVPMFHALGCIGSALTTILAGATLVLIDKVGPVGLLDILVREKCTVLCGVPTLYIDLINAAREMNCDLTNFSLQKCIVAGARCPEKILKDIIEIFGVKDTVIMYGMTEAGSGITSSRLGDPIQIKTETVGTLWPGTEMKFVDVITGEDLPDGAHGEICIRGYNIMKGYYNDPVKTSQAIDKDDWLHTGDVGFLRKDGNLALEDRCKNIIIKNGENIAPKEIEDCLMEHEAIKEAYVVGVPNYRCGEIVFAFIKLELGYQLTLEDIKAYCKGKISTIKIPSKVKVVENFPTSSTGKVLKRTLKEMAKNL